MSSPVINNGVSSGNSGSDSLSGPPGFVFQSSALQGTDLSLRQSQVGDVTGDSLSKGSPARSSVQENIKTPMLTQEKKQNSIQSMQSIQPSMYLYDLSQGQQSSVQGFQIPQYMSSGLSVSTSQVTPEQYSQQSMQNINLQSLPQTLQYCQSFQNPVYLSGQEPTFSQGVQFQSPYLQQLNFQDQEKNQNQKNMLYPAQVQPYIQKQDLSDAIGQITSQFQQSLQLQNQQLLSQQTDIKNIMQLLQNKNAEHSQTFVQEPPSVKQVQRTIQENVNMPSASSFVQYSQPDQFILQRREFNKPYIGTQSNPIQQGSAVTQPQHANVQYSGQLLNPSLQQQQQVPPLQQHYQNYLQQFNNDKQNNTQPFIQPGIAQNQVPANNFQQNLANPVLSQGVQQNPNAQFPTASNQQQEQYFKDQKQYFQNQQQNTQQTEEQEETDVPDISAQPPQQFFEASPAQYVQVQDLAPFKEGEDLRFYIQKFELSYFGIAETDSKKIFRLMQKFQDCETLWNTCDQYKHLKRFSNFKKRLLERHAKTEDVIVSEFETMSKQSNEMYCQFLDRMYAKLSVPGITIDMSFYLGEMYRKLPLHLQRMIKKSQLKDFTALRNLTLEVETSPLFNHLCRVENLLHKQARPNSVFTIPNSQNQQQSQQQQQQNFQPAPPSHPPPPNSQFQPNQFQNRVQGRNQGGRFNGRGGRGQGRTNYQTGMLDQQNNQFQTQLLSQYGNGCIYTCNQDNQNPNYILNQDIYDYEMETSKQANCFDSLDDSFQCQLETIQEEPEQELITLHNYNTRSKNQTQQQQTSNDSMETESNNNVSVSQQPTQQQFTPDPNFRGFQYMDYQQPTYNQVQKQILEAQFSNNVRCLIDRGLFTDENGRIQLTRLKQSFQLPLTIQELENMQEQARQGHIPIYYENFKQYNQDLSTYIEQQSLYSTQIQKISQAGSLKMINTVINKNEITATIDTGAVKTLIALNVVQHFNLQKYISSYIKKPCVKGITGLQYIDAYLQSVPIYIGDQLLCIDIPIIDTHDFQILLASDILDYLPNCVIDIQNLNFSFYCEKIKKQQNVPIFMVKKNKKSLNTMFLDTSNIDAVENTFPNILQIPGNQQIALIDIPFEFDIYHTTKIQYPTLTQKQLELFGIALNKIMSKHSILLCWTSCKTIPQLLYLLQFWGFQYHNVFLNWVKLNKSEVPKMGLGFYTRNNTELLIMAKRGNVSFMRTSARDTMQYFYTLYDTPEVFRHSSKPLKAYELINQVFDLHSLNCIEFFAKQKNSDIQQNDFILYGNEIQDYIQFPQKKMLPFSEAQDSPMSQEYNIFSTDFIQSNSKFQKFFELQDMEEIYKANPQVQNLFEKYFNVFDFDNQVGCANNQVLHLKVKPNSAPPSVKQPRYTEEQLQVLRLTTEEWESKGLITNGFTNYVFYPVIVKKQNVSKDQPLQKQYRVCYNFQPLNEVLEDEPFTQTDSEDVISSGYNARFISVVDLVMAHQQIPVHESQQHLMGLWTPEGIKLSTRGQFGVLPIAKVFSKAIDKSIGHLKPRVRAYADDITIFSETFEEMLYLLEQVFSNLSSCGFVLSHKKGKFFKHELNILGQVVTNGTVKIDNKRISALQDLQVPNSKKQMQRFIGLLTYLRKYIPNLASYLQPLYQSVKSEVFSLNDLQLSVFEQLKYILTNEPVLKLPDVHKDFYLSVHFSSLGFGACLMQEFGEKLVPVAYRSKVLESVDQNKPQYYLKMKSLVQAVKEWKKWIFHRKVTVLTDNKILYQAFNFKSENSVLNHLQAKLFDINIEVIVKPETFKVLKFAQILSTDQDNVSIQNLDELLTEYEFQKQQEHSTTALDVKSSENFKFNFHKFTYSAFFDGACTRKLKTKPIGAYSFIIVDSSGQTVYQQSGEVQCNDNITNNVAENFALLKLLEYLFTSDLCFERIRIIGDSQLTICQVKGVYRINNNAIRALQRITKYFIKEFRNRGVQIILQHVPRKYNTMADEQAQVTIKNLIEKYKSEQVKLQTLAVIECDPVDSIICNVCGNATENDIMFICDFCGYGQHQKCLGSIQSSLSGPQFCKNCNYQIFQLEPEKQDVTLDLEFFEYLQDPTSFKCSIKTLKRCEHLSKFYIRENDALFFKSQLGLKRVPFVSERILLIAQIHSQLGHGSIVQTIKSIQQNFYWVNLQSQVHNFVKQCALCQARKAHYLPMSNVYPTSKGISVWQYVSCDLIEIRSEEEGGERYVLSVICNFCKAPELVPLQSKTSQEVAQAFQDQVIYRYGTPLVVRTDSGGEFGDEFKSLMFKCHIHHVKVSGNYPQGNGMVERLNRTIKQKLQTLYNDEAFNDNWVNLVQLIAFSIRVTISRSTSFSPFQLMYGRDANLPGVSETLPVDTFVSPSQDQLAVYVEHLYSYFKNVEPVVQKQLKLMDQEIKETIEAREFKQMSNMQFSQPIFVYMKKATKLHLETEGVCYFIKYQDPVRRDVIIYFNPKSHRFLKTNISNVKLCNVTTE